MGRASTPALVLLLLLAGACGPSEPEVQVVVLARLGGAPIELERFQDAALGRTAVSEFPRSGSGFEVFRDRLLKEIVVEEVLLYEARQRGVEPEPAALQLAIKEARDQHLDEPIDERFGAAGSLERQLRRRATLDAIEQMLRQELGAGVGIAKEQVDAALPRLRSSFNEPAKLHVRQVFVPDAETARQVKLELDEGKEFVDLALKHNGSDGDLGWMDRSAVPRLVGQATDGLEAGTFSDVLHSPLGYHIFQLLGRREARAPGEAVLRDRVEQQLRQDAVESRLRAWIASRTDELGLVVDEAEMRRLRCCKIGRPYRVEPDGGSS